VSGIVGPHANRDACFDLVRVPKLKFLMAPPLLSIWKQGSEILQGPQCPSMKWRRMWCSSASTGWWQGYCYCLHPVTRTAQNPPPPANSYPAHSENQWLKECATDLHLLLERWRSVLGGIPFETHQLSWGFPRFIRANSAMVQNAETCDTITAILSSY